MHPCKEYIALQLYSKYMLYRTTIKNTKVHFKAISYTRISMCHLYYFLAGRSPSHWIFMVMGNGEKLLCWASMYMAIPPSPSSLFRWPWGPGARRTLSNRPRTLSIVESAMGHILTPRHWWGPKPKWAYRLISRSRRTLSGSGNAIGSRPATTWNSEFC